MAHNQPLTKFVLWAPDHTDADAIERRLSVQSSHLKVIDKLIKDGIVRVGGAALTLDSANAAPADRKISGSFMIFEAESLVAARKLVESDIYYTTGVWDKEKLQVLPIGLATPLPPVPS